MEPWAYEGDILLESPQSDDPSTSRSLATFVSDLSAEMAIEPEDTQELLGDPAPEKPTEPVIVPENPKNPLCIKYDYKMDIEERWRNIGAFAEAHPYEDQLWPEGLEFEQEAFLREMVDSFKIGESLQKLPFARVRQTFTLQLNNLKFPINSSKVLCEFSTFIAFIRLFTAFLEQKFN